MVIESLPGWIQSRGDKDYDVEKLKISSSETHTSPFILLKLYNTQQVVMIKGTSIRLHRVVSTNIASVLLTYHVHAQRQLLIYLMCSLKVFVVDTYGHC